MSPAINTDSPLARYRQLAPAASIKVSPLCLGTMNFGEAMKNVLGECTKETAFEIMDHFYSQGGNFIDTANNYHNGESEEWVGEWMAERGVRDEMVLATKYTTGFLGWSSRAKEMNTANFSGNGSKSLKLSVESSLRRLRTSYIDVLYVHWWDYATSVEELMHALNDLVASGKVLYLGVSDTPAWVVAKANQYARGNGLRRFVVYQGMWNAAKRDFEREIIPMCLDEGMGLCPFGTLGQGRFQTEEAYRQREEKGEGRKVYPTTAVDRQVSKVLEAIADEKGVELLQVALAYVMQKVPYVFPIVGGRKVSHLEGNIGGLEVDLADDEIARIEQAYEFDHGFPHSFLSGATMRGEATSQAVMGPADVLWNKYGGNFAWVDRPRAIRPPGKKQ